MRCVVSEALRAECDESYPDSIVSSLRGGDALAVLASQTMLSYHVVI